MAEAYGLANCSLNNSRECNSHKIKCTIMLCWSCDRIMCIVRIGSLSGLLVENSALIFLVFMLVSAYSCLFLVNLLGFFFQQVLKGVVKDRLEPNWMSFSPLCSQHNLKRKLKINFSLYTEICPVTWFVCVRVSEWKREKENELYDYLLRNMIGY